MAPDKHDLSYYLKCMTGGVLACGVTHTGIVPLDLVKCRKQVKLRENNKFNKNSLFFKKKTGLPS